MIKSMNSGKVLIAVLAAYCLSVLLIFHGTLISMIAIWIRSETFAHGFLILPISLWLAWRMQDRFAELKVQPAPWALALVLAAGLAWLLANLVDVLVVQQLALVALLVSGIWAIAGTAVVRRYAFPLGFLFLSVPMGEELIPPLMVLTADTTEFLVRASGVSIYREGMYLYLPTGTWSVVEACSGARYLIASVTLGLCYAHLTYTSLWRQLAFMTVAIILPILANSARAYVLVMVGHLSEMRYGIGADHLLFGWVFFGAVLMLMFWIGGFWQQPEQAAITDSQDDTPQEGVAAMSLLQVAGVAIFCAGIWSAAAIAMNRNNQQVEALALTVAPANDKWQAVEVQDWLWHPAQPGADRELDQLYSAKSDASDAESIIIGLHLRQYLEQRQDVELVNNQHPLRPDRRMWRLVTQQRLRIDLAQGQSIQADEARVVSVHQNLLIWSWYHIDGRNTANSYLVKMLEAKQQVLEGQRRGTRVFVATPLGEDREQARQVLRNFISDHMAIIEASLDRGLDGSRDSRPENKIGTPVSKGVAE